MCSEFDHLDSLPAWSDMARASTMPISEFDTKDPEMLWPASNQDLEEDTKPLGFRAVCNSFPVPASVLVCPLKLDGFEANDEAAVFSGMVGLNPDISPGTLVKKPNKSNRSTKKEQT